MKKILPKKEYEILKKINTPVKIQNFLDTMPMNFEEEGDTCFSPMTVLEKNSCHCIEGAILAALALRVHGYPPLLLDLTADKTDYDHVVTVFKIDGKWGALSKTNHSVLRYREPVYGSVRELVMSYFHDYVNINTSKKTLRSFARPVNLKRFDSLGWMTTKEEIFYIPAHLADIKHHKILNRKQILNLRPADAIEIKVGSIQEWQDSQGNAPKYPSC
ncbi:MAG: hypothetical protein WCX17_00295 [Parcubacteria group bacterium]|jgi:hypothetical protein